MKRKKKSMYIWRRNNDFDWQARFGKRCIERSKTETAFISEHGQRTNERTFMLRSNGFRCAHCLECVWHCNLIFFLLFHVCSTDSIVGSARWFVKIEIGCFQIGSNREAQQFSWLTAINAPLHACATYSIRKFKIEQKSWIAVAAAADQPIQRLWFIHLIVYKLCALIHSLFGLLNSSPFELVNRWAGKSINMAMISVRNQQFRSVSNQFQKI